VSVGWPGMDPNESDAFGETPLFEAATEGHTLLTAMLLMGRADPSHRSLAGRTALDFAKGQEVAVLLSATMPMALRVEEAEVEDALGSLPANLRGCCRTRLASIARAAQEQIMEEGRHADEEKSEESSSSSEEEVEEKEMEPEAPSDAPLHEEEEEGEEVAMEDEEEEAEAEEEDEKPQIRRSQVISLTRWQAALRDARGGSVTRASQCAPPLLQGLTRPCPARRLVQEPPWETAQSLEQKRSLFQRFPDPSRVSGGLLATRYSREGSQQQPQRLPGRALVPGGQPASAAAAGNSSSSSSGSAGAEDEDDVRLPCGLLHSEVSDLLFRDITPEDYELLLQLDEKVKRPSGCSAASIEQLPEARPEAYLGESCSVCCMDFSSTDAVAELPCTHCFHRDCIGKWLLKHRHVCPLCNAEAFPSEA